MSTFKIDTLTDTTFNMLQGLRNKPKKTAHVKPDLIDVDLVRGEPWINNCLIQLEIDLEETEFKMDQVYVCGNKSIVSLNETGIVLKTERKYLNTINQSFLPLKIIPRKKYKRKAACVCLAKYKTWL